MKKQSSSSQIEISNERKKIQTTGTDIVSSGGIYQRYSVFISM